MQSGPTQFRDWMRRRGFDQRDAAEYLGLHEAHLSMFLNGKRTPGLDNAIALERKTGIPVEAWTLSGLNDAELAVSSKRDKKSE
jgi:transcriptional regulator with XRE-family HTH domain